jgi:hypothetical protein
MATKQDNKQDNKEVFEKVEDKSFNVNFKKTFKQKADKYLSDNDFQTEVKIIRRMVGIPDDGFIISEHFDDWLIENANDHFENLNIAFKNLRYILAEPKYFLDDVVLSIVGGDGYPTDLYLFNSAESFKSIINERPFPGIVHYVIWNKLLIPETNQLQLTFDQYDFPILRFGPKATMNDVRELYPILDKFIQQLKGKMKGKNRFRRNYERNKKLLSYIPHKNVKFSDDEPNRIGKYDKRLDAVDILCNSNCANIEQEKRSLVNLRQIKSRNKKLSN